MGSRGRVGVGGYPRPIQMSNVSTSARGPLYQVVNARESVPVRIASEGPGEVSRGPSIPDFRGEGSNPLLQGAGREDSMGVERQQGTATPEVFTFRRGPPGVHRAP